MAQTAPKFKPNPPWFADDVAVAGVTALEAVDEQDVVEEKIPAVRSSALKTPLSNPPVVGLYSKSGKVQFKRG